MLTSPRESGHGVILIAKRLTFIQADGIKSVVLLNNKTIEKNEDKMSAKDNVF